MLVEFFSSLNYLANLSMTAAGLLSLVFPGGIDYV